MSKGGYIQGENMEKVKEGWLVEDILEYAKEVGGESHHYKVVQLPFNMYEKDGVPCAKYFHEKGIEVQSKFAFEGDVDDAIENRVIPYIVQGIGLE